MRQLKKTVAFPNTIAHHVRLDHPLKKCHQQKKFLTTLVNDVEDCPSRPSMNPWNQSRPGLEPHSAAPSSHNERRSTDTRDGDPVITTKEVVVQIATTFTLSCMSAFSPGLHRGNPWPGVGMHNER